MVMRALVLQSDFGIEDGAVSAMKGVAHGVSKVIPIYDNTHDIPPFDIWAASYRLLQTVAYWPVHTVFVSVVDPGVGSERKSVVVKTNSDQFIVTPDNGTLTHIAKKVGIQAIREIDENVNRLPQSGASHTFHGRDIYAYTGARLAAGVIAFDEVGPALQVEDVISLPLYEPQLREDSILGTIDILDVRFGNLWTNIPRELFLQLGVDYDEAVEIEIVNNVRSVYRNKMTFGRSFAAIQLGEPVLYVNSLDNMAIAINQGSFAKAYNIGTGSNWRINIKKKS
ncbi:S-adenosyl-l-methionine hydroxide adenosyltransferase family protein [Gracilibacillus caseinilyticus]|uniref:S-adenosyl-l-methionine hydroxide adenosyltransferase family protein n=1 Tax=Gracilibacillus caseinilyticus TaxID=2932256 RepID=A0ABY4F1M6_9BACI|nr:S-adenosyl-l-methionine hydroxide adenosyltransferase family protein [Gracilibacillus caseinilyticus]UOQ50574.1 S-adenosyl-l-methionine hydroxide adenosyltransferase family protein [Gracilibacillus caseinilyticus]